MGDDESWDRVGKYVLTTIKRNEQDVGDLKKVIAPIAIDVAVNKVESRGKQAILGFLGGLIPSLGVIIYLIVKNLK